jgi:hypothetical protein
MLDLVGVQEVRWDGSGTELAGEYTFFYRKGNDNHELGSFFVQKRFISAVKRVEFLNDRCHTIVLSVHGPTEDKTDDVKSSFFEKLESVFDKIPKYHMRILLGDFNARVGSEDIFKLTTGNESLYKISKDNAVRVVNFATSENQAVKSTMFPHCNIHKYTLTSPYVKTHHQIYHILLDRRKHSSVIDVQLFRAADCYSNRCLVVAINLKELNMVEDKEKYRTEV